MNASPLKDDHNEEELFHDALSSDDEEIRWDAAYRLGLRAAPGVFERAETLLRSPCSRERSFAADVLGKFACNSPNHSPRCVALLTAALTREAESLPLASLIAALARHEYEPPALIVSYATHASPDVRLAVTRYLDKRKDEESVRLLIELSCDDAARVRDWATFALGTLNSADTPAIREALWNRVEDSDEDTRAEALMGLTERRDERVLNALRRELEAGYAGTLVLEAAEAWAHPSLLPILIALRDSGEFEPSALDAAIQACGPT